MGLVIQATVLCDNCNTTNAPLQAADAPLPNSWMRVQGYANTSNGSSEAIDGYFCPGCVTGQGSRALVKKSADVSELTDGASL